MHETETETNCDSDSTDSEEMEVTSASKTGFLEVVAQAKLCIKCQII